MTSVNALGGGIAVITTAGNSTIKNLAGAAAESAQAAASRPVDGRADGPKASDPQAATRAELPTWSATAGPPDGPGFAQGTLDKCFSSMEALEKEMAGLDPTSPQGSMKMMEIERKLQRVNQLVTMITNMRQMVHEMNMQAIRSIAR